MNYLAEPQRRIKAALLSGIRMTTAQGNRIGQTVDSRKIISRLRKQGMPICSYWNIRKDDSGRTVAKYKTYYYGSPLPAKGSRMGTFDHLKLDL